MSSLKRLSTKELKMITMHGTPVIALHIGVNQTTVSRTVDGSPDGLMALSIGSGKTASEFFRHSPPTPLEMENAIMAVEDEVIRARTVATPNCTLCTSDACIREIALLAGVADSRHMALSIEAVERQFDLLAAFTLGRPATSAGIPTTSGFAATLLILREFMHHLQFTSITIESE
jgi:hypothetical protein